MIGADPLDEYRRKRDFARTPEPPPEAEGPGGGASRFVLHRHEASRAHEDLRLACGPALACWALPRGLGQSPGRPRLAIRTEDHPLGYLGFSGEIPPDLYGGGRMTILDEGTFEILGEELPTARGRGDVRVFLRGRRFRGEWHLFVPAGKGRPGAGEAREWLCVKARDRFAGPPLAGALSAAAEAGQGGAVPARGWRPMRPGGEREPFSDAEWLFEGVLPGEALEVRLGPEGVRAWSREGRRRPFGLDPRCERALSALRAESAVLDARWVEKGALRPRGGEGEGAAHGCLYVHDLPFYEEFDLRRVPLLERKARLRSLLPRAGAWVRVLPHVSGDGEELVEAAGARGLAWVWARRASERYRSGPSSSWVLVPTGSRQRPAPLAPPRRKPAPRIRLTSLSKVLWPEQGITKGELLAYYEALAPRIAPHLEGRATHLLRWPEGVDGESFYQRHAAEGTPSWLRRPDPEGPEESRAVMVLEGRDALLWAVNAGSIDLHPRLARLDTPDLPDVCVFDLDPKGAPWSAVLRVARALAGILDEVGLPYGLKTSGKTGLHLHLPLRRDSDWRRTALLAQTIAAEVVRRLPGVATVERALRRRGGKVYVDVLQNARGQTVVAPYSVRPRRPAAVATPLWREELEEDLDPLAFDLRTVPERVREHGEAWAGLAKNALPLERMVEALGALRR
jgi:bifunctional non-homologous end joining protein LigD